MTTFNLISKSKLIAELRQCNISQPILRKILPLWWDDELLKSPSGLLQIALLIKSRLGMHVDVDDDGHLQISASERQVEYKKRLTTSIEKLFPATSVGQGIASSMTTILRANGLPPPNKEEVCFGLEALEERTLDSIVPTLWDLRIPVIHVDALPSSVPRPAGMIIKIENYITIILAHREKSPAAQSFVVSHEIGHYVCGHMDNTDILADVKLAELDDALVQDTDEQESEADSFALETLRHQKDISEFFNALLQRPSVAVLAQCANQYGKEFGISPAHLALSYAKETSDWATGRMALRFIEKSDSSKAVFSSVFLDKIGKLSVKPDEFDYLKTLQGI